VPYVGGGVGVVLYSESADFAESGDDVDESFTSYHVLGGIDFPLWKWLGAGVEGAYRWVPDALGDEGVAGEFDESDLGGFALRFRLTVGR
jgi:opacity protein-like surface antigen